MASERLIVFVRAPRPGSVKTRLAAAIGPEAATDAYCYLVNTVLSQFDGLDDIELRYTPDDGAGEIHAWLRPGWRALPQGAGDLGQRMHHAFASAFASGAERVVLIGSDCPGIRIRDIESAWAGLNEHELVLGPASDGGYWLVALRQAQPCLFHNLVWSTSTVLTETLTRARQHGLSICLLRELADVDTPEDWKRFQDHHRTLPHPLPPQA